MADQFQEDFPVLNPELTTSTEPRAPSPSFPQLPVQHSFHLTQDFNAPPILHPTGTRTVPSCPIAYVFGNSFDEYVNFLTAPIGATEARNAPHSPLVSGSVLSNDFHGQDHSLPPGDLFPCTNNPYSQFPSPPQSQLRRETSSPWSLTETLEELPQTPDADAIETANSRGRLELLSEAPRFYQCHHCSEQFPDLTRCKYVSVSYGALWRYSGAWC